MQIQRQRVCEIGQYAGNHTRSTDSECLPCAMNDTLYEGQRLHVYTSSGMTYNDQASCKIACRPFSRLRDPQRPALGCVSCETGNVLFKVFSQDDMQCQFTCIEGYTRHGDDCVLQPLGGTASSFLNHTLKVTHVQRVKTDSGGAFRVTMSHTAHGSFAVVVGNKEPSCTGRWHVEMHAHTACCFAGLWRVSTNNQLGIASSAAESCSLPNPPSSVRVSDTQLYFDVSDERLTELAMCDGVHNSSYGELHCVLHVSIVDAILLHHVSIAVQLQLRRGASLAFMPGAHTYVPLLAFYAEVQLAYMDDGRPVFLVISDTVPLPTAGATVVTVNSALEVVQPPAHINCRRYAALTQVSSSNVWTMHGAPVRASTFLRAPEGTSFLKLYYTLRLLEREGTELQKNTMNVAVWRNLSMTHPVCEAAPAPAHTRIGEVLSCSGLGAAAVDAATALHDATETVHGELGGLTSFVARAMHEHVRQVRAMTILAAFALPPALDLLNDAVNLHDGLLDFSATFRSACSANVLCHFKYVHGRGVHFMHSCDTADQQGAQKWLAESLGVLHDAGHVQALCSIAHRKQYSSAGSAFLITMVNTRSFLPRTVQWHDLQNHAAVQSTSRIYALFEFE